MTRRFALASGPKGAACHTCTAQGQARPCKAVSECEAGGRVPGWACAGDGWYDVTIVSPRNFFVYTPLLPSAATGAVELRSITEAVRSLVSGTPWRAQAESVLSFSRTKLADRASRGSPLELRHSARRRTLIWRMVLVPCTAACYKRGCVNAMSWQCGGRSTRSAPQVSGRDAWLPHAVGPHHELGHVVAPQAPVRPHKASQVAPLGAVGCHRTAQRRVRAERHAQRQDNQQPQEAGCAGWHGVRGPRAGGGRPACSRLRRLRQGPAQARQQALGLCGGCRGEASRCPRKVRSHVAKAQRPGPPLRPPRRAVGHHRSKLLWRSPR